MGYRDAMRRNSRSRASYIKNPYGPVATREEAFRVLGLPQTATEGEIKSAFRQAAKEYHPDVNPGDAEAEENFKRAGSAREVLLNKTLPLPGAEQTPRPQPKRPQHVPRETKELHQPERAVWLTLIPDLPIGTAVALLGIRADGLIDVFTKDTYKASMPSLALGVHLIYKFVESQLSEAEKVASKHFVIIARERDKTFKYISLPKLAAMVGYTPSSLAPHAPFGNETMDPDDFE